jgi:hypothetical protein
MCQPLKVRSVPLESYYATLTFFAKELAGSLRARTGCESVQTIRLLDEACEECQEQIAETIKLVQEVRLAFGPGSSVTEQAASTLTPSRHFPADKRFDQTAVSTTTPQELQMRSATPTRCWTIRQPSQSAPVKVINDGMKNGRNEACLQQV